jgi:hypothetical protein
MSSVQIVHVHAGVPVFGEDRSFTSGAASFRAPALDLDALVTERSVPGPAFNLPVGEIISFLEAVGEALRADKAGYLQEALEALPQLSPLSRRMLRNCYERSRSASFSWATPGFCRQDFRMMDSSPFSRWCDG